MNRNNSYFRSLEYLAEDPLSQELEQYQLKAESFGYFKPGKVNFIRNMVLPFHRIIYVIKGPINYTIGQQAVTLLEGDVLFTPANLVYSAEGGQPGIMPEFLYLYFSVLPHHLTQEFVNMLETGGAAKVFHASHTQVEFYFHTIMEEYEGRRPGYYKKIHSYLVMILMELIRSMHYVTPAGRINGPRHSDSVLNMATSYIAGNLTQTIRVEELSHICGVSRTYLYKLFQSSLSLSPQEYILNCKMEYAAQLLRDSHMTITQIARELAFSSSNHFSNCFYKIMHVRPREYRKSWKLRNELT